MVLPSMLKLLVTMVDVALLPTVYWYTPGRLPLTTRVLLYRAFLRVSPVGCSPITVFVTSKAILNVSSSLIGSPFLVQMYSTGGPPLVTKLWGVACKC